MYWKQGKTFSAAFNRRRARKQPTQWDRKTYQTIVAMAKALRLHLENEQQRPQHVATLRSYLLKGARRISKM